ncbi:MAG: response regulator, partial [Treponema sp.]|nr:response regulator [Treponema sp.]
KYTEKGHISFTIAGNVVNDDTVFLTIEIADSGRGIKQENLIQIFNDFMQVDISYNKGIEGTGLGLPISKSLVMAMGGNIVVSSEYGSGSVFKITLPQKIRESGKLAQVENPGDKCVLVYERKEVYAHSIFRTIDNLGVGCTLVHNDADFENEISSGKYNFVLIASNLYNNTIDICKKFEKNIHIVLLVRDSGYSLDNLNLGILYMPVHSISIANMLNGIKGVYSDNTDAFSAVRFTAPEAKVLIVDDIYTNLKVAEGLLLPYQMRVDLCKSGREAVDMVKENNYDLILMDHMMPEMDGIEAAAHIRKWEQKQANSNSASGRNVGKKQIPIAALTANAVSGTREMFLENGFNDFLSKPINLVKLNSVLEKWIPKEKQKKYSGGNRNISSGLSAANNNNAQKTQLNLKIEGIDVEKGYTMLGSKLDSYLLVLSVFVKDSREKAQSVRECLKSGDIRLFTIHIHAIKSAAASIGAMELSNNAKALEEAAKQNDTSFIEQNTGNFLKEMETLLGNITKAIQDY